MGSVVIDYTTRREEINMDNTQKEENKKEENKGQKSLKNIGNKFLETLLSTILSAAVTCLVGICTFSHTLGSIEANIENIKNAQDKMQTAQDNIPNVIDEKLEPIKADISEMDTQVDEMYAYLYKNEGVEDQLDRINDILRAVPIDADKYSSVLGLNITVKGNDITPVKSANIEPETIIGSDSNGVVYIAEDMIGEPLLLVYHEGSKEVYFYGSFNENYHWNGDCLINVYNASGLLEVINESLYDDGKLVSYDILFINEKSNIWYRNVREYNEDSRPGETYSYKLDFSREKNFTSTNARIMDLMDADDLLEKSETTVLSYYSGNMENGEFNDKSGNAFYEYYYEDGTLKSLYKGCFVDGKYEDNSETAYQVILFEDGTVKTLYKGNFVNGKYNDSTGKAWDIVYADDYDFYVYNTGNFKDNKAVEHSAGATSIEEIKSIISKYSFDCELNWKEN